MLQMSLCLAITRRKLIFGALWSSPCIHVCSIPSTMYASLDRAIQSRKAAESISYMNPYTSIHPTYQRCSLQTRLQAMAPITTIDMAAAAIFCIRYGMSWWAAALRYGCCLLVALMVNIYLSRASRAHFIAQCQKQQQQHLKGESLVKKKKEV